MSRTGGQGTGYPANNPDPARRDPHVRGVRGAGKIAGTGR